jgi:hypothetical protein
MLMVSRDNSRTPPPDEEEATPAGGRAAQEPVPPEASGRRADGAPEDTDAAAEGSPVPPEAGAEGPTTVEREEAEAGTVWDEPVGAPRPRRVVQVGRGLFLTAAVTAGLLIAGLAASTAWLALDRGSANDPVVATVDGERIRRSEYDRAVARGNGEDILEGLVLERLVEIEARRRGITIDEQETARLLDEQKRRFGSDDEFQEALDRAGVTEAELRHRLRLNEILRRLVADETAVTEQEVAQRYEATKDRFAGQPPEQAKEQIRTGLEQEKVQAAVPALLDRLKAGAKIEMRLPGKT